jgi:Asp-tRNA(Asn)/Glu-tRNA(Gln) amidotransferase A subunit family amidase
MPSCSVPVGLGDEGHPVGLQLAAGHLEEPRLLAIAIALDEAIRFFEHKPPVLEGVQ